MFRAVVYLFNLLLGIIAFTCLPNIAYCQTSRPLLQPKVNNYTAFSDGNNSAQLSQGGDGEQPMNMTMLNARATEVLAKRTANSKYYLDKANPSKFYQLFSYGGSLNYKKNGHWLTVDQRLHPAGKDLFKSGSQQEPVGFDMAKSKAFIETTAGLVYFNNWVLSGTTAGATAVLARANWSRYTAGDDGLMVHDIFPGIDAEMTVQLGAIKTNFIIRKNLFPGASDFVFTDNFAGSATTGELVYADDKHHKAAFYLNGKAALNVKRAIAYTEKNASANFRYLDYTIKNNHLSFSLSAAYINEHLPQGSVIVDPLVEGNGTLEQNAILGSMNCGSYTNYCNYNFMVPTPAKATLTGVSFKWGFYAASPAGQNHGNFALKTGNCSSGFYSVVNPTINTGPGTVSTQGFFSPIGSLVSCLPQPSCQSQNVPMEMDFFNTYCGGISECSDTYVRANEPLVIKIEGHTLELQFITSPLTICQGNTTSLNVIGMYGVPPYTYKWDTGETRQAINVSPAVTTTYNATITDACGTIVNASTKVTVTPTPVIQSVSSNGPLCAGSDLILTTPAVGGAQYNWTGPGNFSSTSQSPVIPNVTPSQSGQYRLVISVNGCPSAPMSTNVEISTPITPAVSISASATTVCAGTPIDFRATPVNGGTNPAYQWTLNGVNTGTNAATYSNSSLKDGDILSCILTSSAGCTSSPTAQSNNITIKVNPVTTPQVSIVASTATTICDGTTVTFTATPINGGASPAYQWMVNGNNVSSNDVKYVTSALKDGDVVSCVLTSNAICTSTPTAISNNIKFTVVPLVTPGLTITASANAICPGTAVVFTATPVNGGANPSYRWTLNGNNVGTNSNSFASSTLNNNDVVACVLTSSITCTTAPTGTSNAITMSVSTPVTPTISITSSATTVCAGTIVNFTAAITNGGTNPVYQWKLNGANTGTNAANYSNATLNQGDVISCVLTSSAACVTSATATSGNISMTVNPVLNPMVSISASATSICAGTQVIFSAAAVNCGNVPKYAWYINGNSANNATATLASTTLRNGDVITCRVTPEAGGCYAKAEAISNEVTVVVSAVPVVTAGRDTTVFKGSSFTLMGNASGNIARYQWSPATYLSSSTVKNPVVTPLITTTYTLNAISTANCESSAQITVKVLSKIEVPNTFTPNGDGVNDTWAIKGLSDYTGAVVNVYNRYGKQIYRAADNKAWDGNMNNKPLPAGTYYYIIDPKNNTAPIAGWVVVLR